MVDKIGLGEVLEGLVEPNYNNDEQIDNQLCSILFQFRNFGIGNGEFTDALPIEQLFQGVLDIGAIDIQRGRDRGIVSYNDLRVAYGLEKVDNFYDLTGENPQEIAEFVDSQQLVDVDGSIVESSELIFNTEDINLDAPSIIDFIAVLDRNGNHVSIQA